MSEGEGFFCRREARDEIWLNRSPMVGLNSPLEPDRPPERTTNPYEAPATTSGRTDLPPTGPYGQRYDRQHRGPIILTFGIISLVSSLMFLVCCNFLSFVSLGLGIAAIVMARSDFQMMDSGVMDPNGRSTVSAGFILGIIGTAIGSIGLLFVIAMIVFWAIAAMSNAGRF